MNSAATAAQVSAEAAVMVDVGGAIATLTLNRPQRGNSIDIEMAQALLGAAEACAADAAIRCVVLTGAGKIFCAGGNLMAFKESGDLPKYLEELLTILNKALLALGGMNKPLVVLVNGPAAGAGLSMALAGDIVLAADNAHFTAAYTAVGLTPDGGLTWWLPRVVGMRQAQEMILTNRRVAGDEAVKLGLVTRTVAADALAAEGQKLAEGLARSAVSALGASRSLLADSFQAPLADHLQAELKAIVHAARGRESATGITAFLEKRPADFTAA